MDTNLLGSSDRRIPQARILKWAAISSSRRSSQPRDGTPVFCIGRQILYPWKETSFVVVVVQLCTTLCDPMNCSMPALHVPHHLLEFAQVYVH